MRLDAHQHFWALKRGDYGWLTPDLAPIYRDFLPADLSPMLAKHGIDGTILVQAAPTVAETEFMLGIADAHAFVKGVVGWVDFASETAPRDIARLAANTKLVGLRPMIQDIPDPDWMLKAALHPAFEALIGQGLTFDALTLPQHLSNLRRLLARYPHMRVVIDHGSKPNIAAGQFDDWADDMAILAKETACFCKLSGLVTEAGPDWTAQDLQRYCDHILQCFGAERVIWGSDWPVCTLAASYDQWVETTDIVLKDLSAAERASVLGGAAQRAYGLAAE